MTERERLIGKIKKSLFRHIYKSCNLSENIADDLLADGVIVPLYKVGDKVYTSETRRVKELVITFCGNNSRGEYKMIAADDGFKNILEFWDYDIGKTVFLTKEEATKELKE